MLRGTQFIVITAPFMVLATIILILRLYTRLWIGRNAGAEDVLVVFAWAFALVLFVLLASVRDALSLHVVALISDANRAAEFLKLFFVGIFLYNFSLTSSKLSIALQYRRVFTDGRTSTSLWLIIALIIVNCIWPFFTNLFFCNPIRKFWHPEVPGTCLNRKGVWFSYAGANIATSLILLVSPLPAIWKLQMRLKTKVFLCLILSLGIFDVILSCLRLASLEALSKTIDVGWYIQPVAIWSCLESTVAIICASAPALKPLITNLKPKSSSTRQTAESYSLRDRKSRRMRGIELGSDTGTIVDDGKSSSCMGDLGTIDGDRKASSWMGDVGCESEEAMVESPRPRTAAGRIGSGSSHTALTCQSCEVLRGLK